MVALPLLSWQVSVCAISAVVQLLFAVCAVWTQSSLFVGAGAAQRPLAAADAACLVDAERTGWPSGAFALGLCARDVGFAIVGFFAQMLSQPLSWRQT